jgi:hypothetical protein
MDVPRKNMTTRLMTPNETINSAYGKKEGDPGALPAGGKTPFSGLDGIKAASAALKEKKEAESITLMVNDSKLKLKQLEIDTQKLTQMANSENQKAVSDSINSARSLVNSLKDRLSDPLTSAADKDKAHKQIDASEDLIFRALNTAHKGLALPTTAPPPPAPADTSTAPGLLKTVKGYVSDDSKPVLEKYIAKANSYDQFVSTLSAAQASLPDATKIPLTEYRSLLSAGKSYYDNLPKVKQKTAQEDAARKLDTIRAKHPKDNITAADLNEYDDTGDRIITPDLT